MARNYKAPRHSNDNPIALARLGKGMTQAQLAEMIGETQNKISLWERGKFHPPISALKKIAEALDTDLLLLLEGQTQKQHSNIADYRRKKGMTQIELADAVGVSQTYISYCECGVRQPEDTVLEKMAEILNTDASNLVNASPDGQKGPK